MADALNDERVGLGAVLAYSTDDSSYTPVVRVKDTIDGPGVSTTSADVTDFDDSDGFIRKIAGASDAGQITFAVNHEKDNTDTLYGLIRTMYYWRVALPGGGTWKCQGYMSGFSGATPRTEGMTDSITIELSGKPSYSAGTTTTTTTGGA